MNKFCIVIPTRNSMNTLRDAVESALLQEFDDFIVYVSDNASDDGSRQYLEQVQDKRMRAGLFSEVLGKTENWNRAFNTAPPAEYFVMLHSDDALDRSALKYISQAIESRPGGVLYCGNHDRLSVDGECVTRKGMWPWKYALKGQAFDRLQVLANTVTVVGTTFSAATFRAVNGFPVEYEFFQDMEFFHRVAKIGEVVYFPRKAGLYRDAPLRPLNRLQFCCEQVKWLQKHLGCWPEWMRGRILDSHIQSATAEWLQGCEAQLPVYINFLESQGVRLSRGRHASPRLSHLTAHRLYKIWITGVFALRR